MTIEKRLKSLEINIKSTNKRDVAIIGKDADGLIYCDGKTYTPTQFEQFKVAHGVEVVINLGDIHPDVPRGS